MSFRTRTAALGWGLLATAGALVAAPSAHAATVTPLFPLTCGQGVTFTSSNEGWRDQSFMQGGTAGKFTDFGAAGWTSSDGDPTSGSLEVPDGDNGWQEAVTPALGGQDHSVMVGKTLTFAYKYATSGQSVSNNVYVALRGNSGQAFYFNFKSQVDSGNAWNTVTVPMDASKWVSSFTYNDGPTGTAPTAAAFAAVLKDLDELAISVEGSNVQNDLTRIDNLQLDCTPEPATGKLDLSCKSGVTFDTSNEAWREQSFMQGGTAGKFTPFGNAAWIDDDGDPAPGSIEVPDLDNGWMEAATPELAGADHGDLAGTTLTFSYKYVTPGQSVSNNVYVAVRGNGGQAFYFPFKDQVDAGNDWATITVPFDASKWVSSFTYDDGPTGTAPSASAFAAVLGDLDELAISVEGSNVLNDVTRIDSLKLDCSTAPGTGGVDPVDSGSDGSDPVLPETGAAATSSTGGWLKAGGATLAVAGLVTVGAAARRKRATR